VSFRFVFNQFGLLLLGFGIIMLALAAAYFGIEGALDHEIRPAARRALLISGAVGLILGGTLWLLTRRCSRHLGRREALLLVAMSWILGAAFAALPSFLWAWLADAADHPFHDYVNCYFEAMSGLTTTGATVLSDIDAMPRSLLLWRATTHWLGGIGIVVLFVAVLPSLGTGGKRLYRVEAPGPSPEGLQPQIRETARVLFLIYLALTVVQVVALRLAGMSVYEAVCHTFATLATGGFSTANASVGAFDGPAVRIVVIVFMVLAGANFGLYYQLIRGRGWHVLRDTELQFYLALLAIGSVLVFIALLQAGPPIVRTNGEAMPADVGTAVGEAIFTTVSIQTTTGFCTSDFNRWPFLAQAVLVLLMFVGGCSGSTGGGIKVIRVWVAIKVLISEIERVFRPNVVRPVKVGRAALPEDLKLSTVAFVLGIVVLFAAGGGAIMLLEQANPDSDCSFTSAATASLATLCTIGPGLAQVGAVENYGWFSLPSKLVMCTLMALGRLEIFAIIVLFSPRFWRE
jgi:trk system potassium uptake protein TrkH